MSKGRWAAAGALEQFSSRSRGKEVFFTVLHVDDTTLTTRRVLVVEARNIVQDFFGGRSHQSSWIRLRRQVSTTRSLVLLFATQWIQTNRCHIDESNWEKKLHSDQIDDRFTMMESSRLNFCTEGYSGKKPTVFWRRSRI